MDIPLLLVLLREISLFLMSFLLPRRGCCCGWDKVDVRMIFRAEVVIGTGLEAIGVAVVGEGVRTEGYIGGIFVDGYILKIIYSGS